MTIKISAWLIVLGLLVFFGPCILFALAFVAAIASK